VSEKLGRTRIYFVAEDGDRERDRKLPGETRPEEDIPEQYRTQGLLRPAVASSLELAPRPQVPKARRPGTPENPPQVHGESSSGND